MIQGSLFTIFFLEEGIRATEDYRALAPDQLAEFAAAAHAGLGRLAALPHPTEAETEQELIAPLLAVLGWDWLVQQEPGAGRRDIADALLFADPAAKARALAAAASAERFRHGLVVAEFEARETRLDRAGGSGETPSTQILRYLGRADAQSGGAVRWGLLTNGRRWRLYWSQARARADGFVELDLPDVLAGAPAPADAPEDHWLRVFLLLFRRDALALTDPAGLHFLDRALDEGRRYEERLTAALSRAVFDQVFPDLIAGLAAASPEAPLAAIREAGLRFLFRLLFLLYAEDRALLPVARPAYRAYSLRGLREAVAAARDDGRAVSGRGRVWWQRLATLFAAVGEGDPALELPAYNGGLFASPPGDPLAGPGLPDATLAPLIDALSRERTGDRPRWINYRDLSVQHLGAIYEQLLEREPVRDDDGQVRLRPTLYVRRVTGSYYTPDELVGLVLRHALAPLLDDARAGFAAAAAALATDPRPLAERLTALAAGDPAAAFLRLRVCDPAMGSGHFLVALVDLLAAEILGAIAEAPEQVAWAGGAYRSPLVGELARLRARLRAEAAAGGFSVAEDQLDDRHLIRRMVLKRVVHGVDRNPMAVELAKLALWLHSFTVGAPLSFLDHHLRCGDSLFGEFVHPVEADLRRRFGLAMHQAVVRARLSAAGMAEIEALADADLAEVHASATAFAGVEEATAELRGLLDLYHAARWQPPADPVARKAREALFAGFYGDPARLGTGAAAPRAPDTGALMTLPRAAGAAAPRNGNGIDPAAAFAAAQDFLAQARALAADRRFLHWEAAFPGVWEEWERATPAGGFDAVIGNPPWDRMKMQEVEWFAAHVPEVAHAQRAADRKRLVAGLRAAGAPAAAAYDAAAAAAETAARVAAGGSPFAATRGAARDYPLLSGGDTNLYALFVERAMRLVRPRGVVGLVVPSGIAADLGAAPFFREISGSGRLAVLFDFENRHGGRGNEAFFPDVDSRFKFCTLIFGGAERRFAEARLAFFQPSAAAAEAAAFALTPEDFAAVNPNTGTAPVFRGRRDAALTRAIHARLPVLVDRRVAPARSVWPVRYLRMLDMTNDSGSFRTAAELTADGAYPVVGNRWEKGRARWLALMTGRSIHQFDHRAASVAANPASLHNPFVSVPTTPDQHRDPGFFARPEFWVAEGDIAWPEGAEWAIGFRDIARPTDARTVIAAAVPRAGYANTLPLLLPDPAAEAAGGAWPYRRFAPLLLANLNAFVLDYVARQKVQGTHLNYYIVEQLPLVPPEGYARRFGTSTAEALIRADVLALSFTAHDLTGFAREQGLAGPPFAWDEEQRLRRRARLDAAFFHLYGLDRDAADYVLSSFPIVRREEEARWGGRFRSRDLILGYMAALAAGAPEAEVAG